MEHSNQSRNNQNNDVPTALDWLFGQNYVGWLKTALAAGMIGLGVMYLWNPNMEDYENKYQVLFLGLPIWWTIKYFYWKARENSITQMIIRGDVERAGEHLMSLFKWHNNLYNRLSALLDDKGKK